MVEYQITELKLHQKSKVLEIAYDNGKHFELTCEFLRIHSPSAEVKGHGANQGKLPIGKQDVNIIAIEPVGNYAVKLIFDDGHNTGIYSWQYLYDLGENKDEYWARYRAKVKLK